MTQALVDLAKAHKSVEHLKKLPSWVEAERDLREKSADELRAMVMVQLAQFKRQQLGETKQRPGEAYERWSQVGPL